MGYKQVDVNWMGQVYMPLNLKWVLQRNGVSQAKFAAGVVQFDGKPLSASATSALLNFNVWPKLTPVHSIQKQTEKLLRDSGADDDEIAIVWDVDTADRGRDQHPVAVHEGQFKRAKQKAIAAVDSLKNLEICMLSEQARKHFGIFSDPFHNDVNDEKDVFKSPTISYVRQAVFMSAKLGSMVAVIGDSGAGKSVIRRDFFERIEREKLPMRIIMPRTIDKTKITSGAICEAIIRELAPTSSLKQTTEGKALQAEKLLLESFRAGNQHVLVIEEAHKLTDATFTLLKQFWEIGNGFKKLLAIVLFGQTELTLRLDARANPSIREFINRCETVSLPALDLHLDAYLAFKFKRVEMVAATLFDKDVYDAIRERLSVKVRGGALQSHVTALMVNNVVTKALNVCAELGLPKVSAAVIKDL